MMLGGYLSESRADRCRLFGVDREVTPLWKHDLVQARQSRLTVVFLTAVSVVENARRHVQEPVKNLSSECTAWPHASDGAGLSLKPLSGRPTAMGTTGDFGGVLAPRAIFAATPKHAPVFPPLKMALKKSTRFGHKNCASHKHCTMKSTIQLAPPS